VWTIWRWTSWTCDVGAPLMRAKIKWSSGVDHVLTIIWRFEKHETRQWTGCKIWDGIIGICQVCGAPSGRICSRINYSLTAGDRLNDSEMLLADRCQFVKPLNRSSAPAPSIGRIRFLTVDSQLTPGDTLRYVTDLLRNAFGKYEVCCRKMTVHAALWQTKQPFELLKHLITKQTNII
jgi:hypothetical protein